MDSGLSFGFTFIDVPTTLPLFFFGFSLSRCVDAFLAQSTPLASLPPPPPLDAAAVLLFPINECNLKFKDVFCITTYYVPTSMYVSVHGTTDCAYHSSRQLCERDFSRPCVVKERKEWKKKVVRLSRVTNWNLENVKFSGTKIKVISSLKSCFFGQGATARCCTVVKVL